MPILFQRRSRSRSRRRSSKKTQRKYSETAQTIGQKQKSQNHTKTVLTPRSTERDNHYGHDALFRDDGKEGPRKRKLKTLRKIKSIFKKGKEKLCKECERVSKICTCHLAHVDRTILVLRDILKVSCQNVNQSALGGRGTGVCGPRLRSKSCTMAREVRRDDAEITYHINKGIPDLQKYSKYVPVRKMWGPLYPRSFVEDYKMVWLDMQVWYSKYFDEQSKQNTNDDLNSSKSEGSLTESASKRSSFEVDVSITDEVKDEVNRESDNSERAEHQRRSMLDQRFRLKGNAEYLSMVSWQRYQTPLDCRLQLFVSTAEDHDLVHLKTEMLVTCIRGFVQADGDFEVLWVADIKKILPAKLDLTDCELIDPEVAIELASKLSEVKAVLFVSRAASTLLRHQGVGFLDTLAVTAGVERNALIVLPHALSPSGIESARKKCVQPEQLPRPESPPDPLF